MTPAKSLADKLRFIADVHFSKYDGDLLEYGNDLIAAANYLESPPPSTPGKAELIEEKYLVWSNEHNAWWGANHRGYVCRIESAGRYTKEEASKICMGANYSWDIERERPSELPISESAALIMGVQKEYRGGE